VSGGRRAGAAAVAVKGWWRAQKWLLLRRAVQLSILGLFLLGPWAGVWIVKGSFASSLTLDVVPLTDPYMELQSLAAGHTPEQTAILGALIVAGVYLLVGGRVYCSWACPVNIVTDAARWLRQRLGLGGGWRPTRNTRVWLLAVSLPVSAITGTIAWELVNPVTMLHRGVVYGMGLAWMIILAVFLFDVFVSRRGWCGRLCPVGAFYGLLGSVSVLRVSAKHRGRCDDCMDCDTVCPEPHVITPALKGEETGAGPVILSRDCTNCGRCIDVCPKNVFAFSTRFHNDLPELSGAALQRRSAPSASPAGLT
jgi:ferredoxin-type protein NapH